VKPVRSLKVREYVDSTGISPFRNWLDSLDTTTKARIQARILRIESGNLGDHKSVGGGVMELRFDFGPGYRVYLGKDGGALILLLMAGDKGSQAKDIKRAQELWSEYLKRGKNGQKK
jgi:putative addiction module killer protein